MEEKQRSLFDLPLDEKGIPPIKFKRITYPVWTEKKAKLIQRYLYLFVLITKHGTYIDGFAGPQKADEPDTWAAKLALDNYPKWMRKFFLFDQDKDQHECLLKLKASHSEDAQRAVEVFCGDFNILVEDFLNENPIKEKEATFCLLDQRTFECKWSTVKKIAGHKKAGYKIEIFYFLPICWLDRSLSAIKKSSKLKDWWGKEDWKILFGKKPLDRASLFCSRFKDELGYAYVHPWPIYEKQSGGRTMYYMIHATDHPEAPKLMARAYENVVKNLDQQTQLSIPWN